MKRILLILLLTILHITTKACSCGRVSLEYKFKFNDFIALAKITSVTVDDKDNEYHNIEIDIINLYKGEKITKLKIHSHLNSSCAFFTEKNSTWLIFANKHGGDLIFDYCSGALQFDRKFDLAKYPNADINYKKSLDLKISVLDWMKKSQISFKNDFNVGIQVQENTLKSLNSFNQDKNDFAVIAYEIHEDLSLGKVQLIKKFKNNRLSNALIKQAKASVIISHRTLKEIPEKTKQYIIYYFYPNDKSNEGFVSTYDL